MARGEISAAASIDAHREIMKEGELLEEEEAGEEEVLGQEGGSAAGPSGTGVVLSLDEVSYDRDLQWCNRASEERPRPQAVTRVVNPFLNEVSIIMESIYICSRVESSNIMGH